MSNLTDSKNAASEFAAEIQKLAEDKCIDSLSIHIHAFSSDKLFTLAQAVGIKEIEVGVQFGS